MAGSLLAAALLGCVEPSSSPIRPPHLGTLRQEVRPTEVTGGGLWHFDSGEVVESLASAGGGFRVHYTRAGRNQVPLADANTDGVPDFVEQVAGVYDAVATYYAGTLGFRPPLSDVALTGEHGGDGRFDVYLLDFALSSDGAFQVDGCPSATPDRCIGYVVQENDFAGYGYPNPVVATRILGSHEYFHAVQAAYDDGQGVVVGEGTAVWASEAFDPTLNDFEGFLGGYLSRPDRSLDVPPPGPVPSFAYGSAIFFEFLSQKFNRELVRRLWERCENGQGLSGPGVDPANPYWVSQLDLLLKAEHASSFSLAFTEFVTWNLYTSYYANPSKSYANGSAYPRPAMVAVSAPYQEPRLRVFYASAQYFRADPAGRSAMTAALVDPPGAVPSELEGLTLLLAVRRGTTWSEVQLLADPASGAVSADTAGATEVVVAVVNGAQTGSSKRPGLCLGTPAEVAACKLSLVQVDGGVPDGGALDGGGEPEVDAGSPGGGGPGGEPPQGCGCGAGPSGVAGLGMVLALLARRRRPER